MNESSFRFYGKREYLAEVFPKAAGKNFLRAISELGSVAEWRVGSNGLVKLKYEFASTRSVPTAEEVFFAWLAAEITAFEAEPFFREALRLREWDDRGKIAGLKTPELGSYRA